MIKLATLARPYATAAYKRAKQKQYVVLLREGPNRANTTVALGMIAPFAMPKADDGRRGRILIVDDRASSAERLAQALSPHHNVFVEPDAHEALFKAAEDNVDLIVVSLGLRPTTASGCAARSARSSAPATCPSCVVADVGDRQRVLRGLDMGVNDYLTRPVDRNELLARARTQLRQKRYADSLREKVQQSIELALFDPLTGLNNRRFMENHLATMLDNAKVRRAPLTLMILDIDHFKRVNDTYGHDCGDEVLKGFADRLRGIIRGGDLLCRLGGEEFVIVMPGVNAQAATRIAERARLAIQEEPFPIEPRRPHHPGHGVDRPRRTRRRRRRRLALPPRRPGALPRQGGTAATASAPTRPERRRPPPVRDHVAADLRSEAARSSARAASASNGRPRPRSPAAPPRARRSEAPSSFGLAAATARASARSPLQCSAMSTPGGEGGRGALGRTARPAPSSRGRR